MDMQFKVMEANYLPKKIKLKLFQNLKTTNVYDFCFLASGRSFNPPTPTLQEGKNVGIDVGVDSSFKQHSMTNNVVSIGSI
jgi:hypothetical protein